MKARSHNYAADPVLRDQPAFSPVDAGLPGRRTAWRRLADDRVGQVTGIPSLTGQVMATDGVLALLRTTDGREAIVHLASMQYDRPAREAGSYRSKKPETSEQRKRKAALAEYV